LEKENVRPHYLELEIDVFKKGKYPESINNNDEGMKRTLEHDKV